MDDGRTEGVSSEPTAPPRRTSRLVVAALAAFLAVLSVAGYKTWRDLVTVEARADELRGEIARTAAEIERLEQRRDRLRDDPVTLERVARRELHMVHPDDVVVMLPPGAEAPESAAAPGAAPPPDR